MARKVQRFLETMLTLVFVLSQIASRGEAKEPYPPWGPNCNGPLLNTTFAMDKAPDFNVPEENLKRIKEVVAEVKRGYGGTLVVSSPDKVLDSPAFLAHYLRAFAEPDDVSSYDYCFERIMARISSVPAVLADKRLDWDVWRAYLFYDDFAVKTGNFNEYEQKEGGDTYIHNLDSAKDLLWGYLGFNARNILNDKKRLRWWINSLTAGMKAKGGRPLRKWFLLQLVSFTDSETARLDKPADDKELRNRFPWIEPKADDPFIIVDDAGVFLKTPKNQPPFLKALEKVASSQKLAYTLWGIDSKTMPPTKAYGVDLAPRLSQFAPASILGQESWSKKPTQYRVSFFRPVGQRALYFGVRMPKTNGHDGVYFFTYNARLYVWLKADMDDAVIQMLRQSKLVDDPTHAAFLDRGFKQLETTGKS